MGSIQVNVRPLGHGKTAACGLHCSDLVTASLLPLAYLAPFSSLPLNPFQTNLCIISIGLVLISWLTFGLELQASSPRPNVSLPHIATAALVLFLLPPDSRTSSYVVYWAIIILDPLARALLSKFPRSFTFGEIFLVSQAGIIFLSSLLLKILSLDKMNTREVVLQSLLKLKSTIEQLSLIKTTVVLLLVFWAVLVLLSVGLVILYNSRGWAVTTKTRKLFHLAVVLVFVSGLVFSPLALYLSSILALSAMVVLETVRVCRLHPGLSDLLSKALQPFLDTKDQGDLILTNIYLLVGVSWPVWLWPGNLLFHQPTPLLLYAGVVSVGVADSAASVVGSWLGKVKWGVGGSEKTIEGSLAAALSALTFVACLASLGLVLVTSWKGVVVGVLLTVMVEALSDQVDNITLPLVMYLVLAVWG